MQEQKPNGEMENMNQDHDSLKTLLFQLTMQKKWELVIQFYETHSWAHKAKLTKSEETALHIAISSCHAGRTGTKPTYIRTMINCIPKNEEYNVLSMQNTEGNTPLHLAATVGSVAICKYISMKRSDLIKIRNSKGETPVFRAAKHGNTEAFLCFHHFYEKKEEIQVERPEEFESLCRRHDGTTVLHTVIFGAYFRLAYQIICYYPKLVNSVNVDGESPLHVLAKKPNVFKSSSYLGFYDSIIYSCLPVDELKRQKYNQGADQNELSPPTSEINFPENYWTCGNIFHFLLDPIQKSIKAALGSGEENQRMTGTISQPEDERNADGSFPPNYATCFLTVKFGFAVMINLIAAGIGYWRIATIKEKKQKYSNAFQIMKRMILSESSYNYKNDGMKPMGEMESHYLSSPNNYEVVCPLDDEIPPGQLYSPKPNSVNQAVVVKNDTPVLIASKTGIYEMVEGIHEKCPEAIEGLDSEGKNVLMLAAENRQIRVLEYLFSSKLPEYMFNQVDNEGNSILHLAAKLPQPQPWRTPGLALQMQLEIKWYEFVKNSILRFKFSRHNKNGETPYQIFNSTHEILAKDNTRWLTKTSESCSLIAALIATVAFATSSTVPGGVDNGTGHPILRDHTAFHVFSITSVLALCLSVTALVFFLSIITSRSRQRDFKQNLPWKLLMGLTTLFASLVAMAVSFFAGHAFILKENLWIIAFPLYSIACAPLTILIIAKLPLYFDLLRAYCKRVPLKRSNILPISMSDF